MLDVMWFSIGIALCIVIKIVAHFLPKKEWVGLTDDDINLLEELYAPPVHPDFVNDADHCFSLIKHVEAKLKEKNGV